MFGNQGFGPADKTVDPIVEQVISSIESEDGWRYGPADSKSAAAYLHEGMNLGFSFGKRQGPRSLVYRTGGADTELLHATSSHEEALIHAAWKRRALNQIQVRRLEILDEKLSAQDNVETETQTEVEAKPKSRKRAR